MFLCFFRESRFFVSLSRANSPLAPRRTRLTINKRKRQSCMGKQCAWIWERPNTYLCTGTSSRRLAVRFLELQFFCRYVRSRRFASRPVTPATRVTLPYTQNPVTLEEDFAWSTYLLTNPAPAGCTQSAWYDKKESVSLVRAIREAVCGDWERPLPQRTVKRLRVRLRYS